MAILQWFVHIQGETFGPLSNEIVVLMIKQNRLQFSDYIWRPGLEKWIRISELDEFLVLMPQYPKVPIPEYHPAVETAEAAKTPEQAPADSKAASSKRARVRRFARVIIEAKFVTADFGSFDVHNISEGGLYVKSTTILVPIGTNLIFRLESHNFPHSYEMSGAVVRFGSSNDPPGFAIEFTKVSNEQKKILKEYISTQKPM